MNASNPSSEDTSRDILLVEDSVADAQFVAEALSECDIPCQLHVARDGEEALDFVGRRGKFVSAPRPDLILLDLNLPGKTGHDVLSEIKNDPRLCQIPVVVLSSSKADNEVRRAYAQHANSYITKPIGLDALFKVINGITNYWFSQVTLPPK
jgi:chemotaxis family two-component system response regulator Rcp1